MSVLVLRIDDESMAGWSVMLYADTEAGRIAAEAMRDEVIQSMSNPTWSEAWITRETVDPGYNAECSGSNE